MAIELYLPLPLVLFVACRGHFRLSLENAVATYSAGQLIFPKRTTHQHAQNNFCVDFIYCKYQVNTLYTVYINRIDMDELVQNPAVTVLRV